MFARIAVVTSLSLASFSPAFASGLETTTDTPNVIAPLPIAKSPQLVFTLRGGASYEPGYFGSDDYEVGPDFGFKFNSLTFRNGRSFGNPDPWGEQLGFGIGGSFRFIEERNADDFDELAGLEDVDAAIELGLSARYGTENFLAFGELRRGFGGHEGWVGEIGADAIVKPTDRLRLSVGPRLLFGDDIYADTYFGVTDAEASAALPAYDPDGGMISAGVEFGARYQINDVWGLEGAVTWDKFTDDAADSPIVEQGSDKQWGIRFGVTRVFSIGG